MLLNQIGSIDEKSCPRDRSFEALTVWKCYSGYPKSLDC